MKRRCTLPFGPPQQKQHGTHHKELVDVIPRLHHHSVQPYTPLIQWSHQIFVVQSAYRPQHRSQYHKEYPLVMLEVYSFLLPATAQHKERKDSHQHPYPLIQVQSFSKDQQSPYQYHHRTGCIDRPYNSDRQILHAKIAEYPR